MSDNIEKKPQPGESAILDLAYDQNAQLNVYIGYVLMGLGLFTIITWFMGAFWAMFKRNEATGTFYEDHYTAMIRTFWWCLGLWVVGFILSFVFVGFLVYIGIWIWAAYRIIKGLARMTSKKPYYS